MNSSPKVKLKVACVGTGYFSQFHYEAWHRLDNVEVHALCDIDSQSAQAMAEQYGIAHVYKNLDAMLANHELDLIDVITPPSTHLDVVTRCLHAKRHVMCQKPFGENLSQAQSMTKLALEQDRKLIVHDNFRFMPWFRQVKKILDTGSIGDVLNIDYRLRPGDGQGPDAYLARQPYFQTMPRFLIHETVIHYIDTFRYLLGEITEVSARLRKCNPNIKGEDACLVTLGFANGIQGLIDGNRCVDHSTDNLRRTMGELLVEGTNGCIRLDGKGQVWLREFGHENESLAPYPWHDFGFGGDCVFNLISHVASHFIHGTPIENLAQDYLRNIQLEEAVYASHDERRVKDLPLDHID